MLSKRVHEKLKTVPKSLSEFSLYSLVDQTGEEGLMGL